MGQWIINSFTNTVKRKFVLKKESFEQDYDEDSTEYYCLTILKIIFYESDSN